MLSPPKMACSCSPIIWRGFVIALFLVLFAGGEAQALTFVTQSGQLKYIIPVVVIFLTIAWYSSYRRHVEREEAERKYRDLYDHAPDMFLSIEARSATVIDCNQTLLDITGYSREEIVGRSMLELYHPDCADLVRASFRRFLSSKEVHGVELQLRRKDGSKVDVSMNASAVCDKHGAVLHSRTALRDITGRKQVEAEKLALQQQSQQAQKLESLGVLAGGIAHDFNNILTVIIGHCGLAKLRPEAAKESFLQIEKAAERAAELCRQMLAYAGKTQSVQSRVDMTALVDEMVRMLKSTISQNLVIKLDCSDDIPFVKADPGQLRQIVMNLIINAYEAIGEAQGEISLSLAKREVRAGQSEKDYLGRIMPAGVYVCLEVTDSGCGMDEEVKNRIFEPFFTTKFMGRGLGLSATLGIITAHGGALQFFSQPGQGTRFKVYLPALNGEPSGGAVTSC